MKKFIEKSSQSAKESGSKSGKKVVAPGKITVGRSNSISGNGAIIRKNLAQVRRGKVPDYWTEVVIKDET